ncbi:MAG TPA: FUSC family protein [Opitutaceae bacterium]|nr:FUSC family protein [Opitutaceae bacterium]
MEAVRFRDQLGELVERESLRPDFGRAVRATIALMAPLMMALAGKLPFEAAFAVIAAQNVAMIDVRGAYRVRFSLLAAATLILAACSGLGGLAAAHLGPALAGMAAVAVLGGLCRHLSGDYGPSIAIASVLLYAYALVGAGGSAAGEHHLLAALAGGSFGVVLQVAFWPFRPEHPLRRAVGDAWLAVADYCAALAPEAAPGAAERHGRLAQAEAGLRAALDHAYQALAQAGRGRARRQVPGLERLRGSAVQFALLVGSLNTALESLAAQPGFEKLAPSFQTFFTALTNASRTVALAVVSRAPGHLATFEVRLRRIGHLLRVLQARIPSRAGPAPAAGEVREILGQIESYLPVVGGSLRGTIGRADERAAFSLELFDLDALTLRPLASALNLRWRFDRALLRYTMRLATLAVLGVYAFERLHLTHGYWLPFTVAVVLQPDYGSTRQKAAQRMLGTLAGGILASLMLALHLPYLPLMAATAASSFVFVYLLKRNYGLAVIFITVFVVLLTESSGPVTLDFTIERLAVTLAGGSLALLAALVFWPVWERNRFPPILARAVLANASYLRVLGRHLDRGEGYDVETSLAKRRAEKANGEVFSSLQRMMGDPKNRQDRLEEAAALANGNQRLSRVLNLVAVHLSGEGAAAAPEVLRFIASAADALESLAAAVESRGASAEGLERTRQALDGAQMPDPPAGAGGGPRKWIDGQLARAATEISAMLLAAEAFI